MCHKIEALCFQKAMSDSIYFFVVAFVSGDKSRWLGKYYVFCPRRLFVLELDIFCRVDCGKYEHQHYIFTSSH